MTEEEFLVSDRIAKIKSIDNDHDLLNNAYVSYSGGKDSSVLSKLIDLALPNNNIPRVYINTGIEYKLMVEHVERERERDGRIIIVRPSQNIRDILENYGYPFKSKEHSQKVSYYQHKGKCKTVINYLGEGTKTSFLCPDKLKYNFTDNFTLKVSDKCCYKLKKEPAEKWSKENNKPIAITGIRNSEGGLRQSVKGCVIFTENKLHKFHPLLPLEDSFIEWFVKEYKIELCQLYYPPYNFNRTGCKGCPYSMDLQSQLDTMSILLPQERKQCEYIWSKVYNEYRRINYRLSPQLSLF